VLACFFPFAFFRPLPAFSQRLEFHVSSKREEETTMKAAAAPESSKGLWDPIYSIPIGIAFAIPAISYEWYLVNEETQLAACFIAFCSIVYKQFGGAIYDVLEEDGKRILEEQNKVEDQILDVLQRKRHDIVMQESVVKDAEDIMALKIETYEKLNAAGKIKPQHDFKAQMEKILTLMQAEEANSKEKAKVAMMEEATAAVMQELITNKAMQKASLDNAILVLKGSKGGTDPVKDAYLKFFQWKSEQAKKVDEKKELAEARESMITKLNAVASNEGFFFRFDESGKPKMIV
jgi:Mitochondrial ATP synthase B chain precursor (ATP-synt_B)